MILITGCLFQRLGAVRRPSKFERTVSYYSDDKIRDGSTHTGSRTLALVSSGDKTQLWEPFSQQHAGIYSVTRNLYKNVIGDKLIFEEINHDLSLTFRYAWRTSDKYGFVKTLH